MDGVETMKKYTNYERVNKQTKLNILLDPFKQLELKIKNQIGQCGRQR